MTEKHDMQAYITGMNRMGKDGSIFCNMELKNKVEIRWKKLIVILLLVLAAIMHDNHLASERKHAISIFQNQEEICYKYLLNEQVSSGENTGGKKGLEFLKGYHQKEIEIDGELCLLWESSNNNIITGNHYYCLTMKTDVDLTKYFSTNIVHIEPIHGLKNVSLYSITVCWD